jgi:hypothetical protein
MIARVTGEIYDQREAMQALDEAAGFAGDTIYAALDGLIFRGDKATDVIANMAKALGEAALQAALLGKGRIGGIFNSDAAEDDLLEGDEPDDRAPAGEGPADLDEATPVEVPA